MKGVGLRPVRTPTEPIGEDPHRDAEMFFDEAYRGQPEGTLIAVGPATRPRFVREPREAIPLVVGKTNTYVRVTLLGRRPTRGRGTDADAVALAGFVADLDLNGSPNGRGGEVGGAFDTLDDAVATARALLVPTLLVGSGYGLQAWWLFEEMFGIDGEEARELVRHQAQAWLEALRVVAGVPKVDGVADLSRLMRCPGR